MKRIIVCLIFLISFANAVQCYNGKTYVDIPESKLSDLGYTKYNITHSNFDCKMAYKRYLKVKEIEPINVSYVTKSEKDVLEEEPSKMCFFYLCLLVVIVGVIWLIINVVKDEPQDEWYSVAKKEPIKPKETVIVKQEPEQFRDWTVLIKLEEERQKKEKAYFDAILGKNYPVKIEQVKPENKVKPEPVEQIKPKSTYDLLLERKEWKECREWVFSNKGKFCCNCHSTNKLQVHHKFYLAYPNNVKVNPWEYPLRCFKVLCENCHRKEHQTHKIKVYRISYHSDPKQFKGNY